MDRRTVVGALGFVSLEQLMAQKPAQLKDYQPRYFSTEQYAVIAQVSERIIPHEETSPGAIETGAPYFIDTLCHYQRTMPGDLLKTGADLLHARGFAKLDAGAQHRMLEEIAKNEMAPQTDLERFFVTVKRLTIEAWAHSDDGAKRGLGYRGNHAIITFEGCTHDHS